MNQLPVLIDQISAMNRAWKRARETWGAQGPIATMLRGRKSDLQARLIRENRGQVYLLLDEENIDGEALYSVRLKEPQTLRNGVVRRDADHMPVRMAEELFSEQELFELVRT